VTADASNQAAIESSLQQYKGSLRHVLNAQGKKVFSDGELLKFHLESKEKALDFFDAQPKFGNEDCSKPFKAKLKSVSV
jgi:hypothetical protein